MVYADDVTLVMSAADQPAVLTDDDLREIDEILLDFLQEGRVTPVYAQRRILEESHRETISRGYVQERLARLVEHTHVQNLFDVGLYELVDDPRNDGDR